MRATDTAKAIRARISAGDYEPGAKLNEVTLAGDFGVSRNTLREAFVMLVNQGVVTRIPNRGVFLPIPSPDDVVDVYRARLAIEPSALMVGPFIDTAELRSLVDEAQAAHEANDTKAVAFANQRFHRAIVAGHGSELLDELMDRLLASMRLVFLEVLRSDPNFHSDYISQNDRVVSLLEAGKRREAADELAAQLSTTSEKICRII